MLAKLSSVLSLKLLVLSNINYALFVHIYVVLEHSFTFIAEEISLYKLPFF
jgi:hypothetical protein